MKLASASPRAIAEAVLLICISAASRRAVVEPRATGRQVYCWLCPCPNLCTLLFYVCDLSLCRGVSAMPSLLYSCEHCCMCFHLTRQLASRRDVIEPRAHEPGGSTLFDLHIFSPWLRDVIEPGLEPRVGGSIAVLVKSLHIITCYVICLCPVVCLYSIWLL